MSIRYKILLGCLCLTAMTGLLGLDAFRAEQRLGRLTLEVYDNAFMGMSYLRSAQLGFAGVAAAAREGRVDQAAEQDLLDDLAVAGERAMSPRGRAAVGRLRAAIASAWATARLNPGRLQAKPIAARFEAVVELFAADGFEIRRTVTLSTQAELRRDERGLLLSLLGAVAITAVLSWVIVPPVRRAVAVAQQIAGGRLDNVIPVAGRGETADLLRALDTMQASIAQAMARIHALMQQQASQHAGEIALHHARMEAALDNMAQGLCLFDAADRLQVVNRRFVEMFGEVPLGLPYAVLSARIGFGALPGDDRRQQSQDTPDGRSIALSRQPVSGGGWVYTYSDVSEQRAFERRLIHMAKHDALTGLPNRISYREHIQQKEAAGSAATLAVLSLDLDRFKLVNDTLGHQAGDELLRAVSQRLTEGCRKGDLVVRLGGDEFVVVQDDPDQPEAACSLAARLIASLSRPFVLGGQTVAIGTSVGIALNEAPYIAADTLLKRSDIALYRAKAEGRGTLRVFEEEMDASIQLRRALELELASALDNGEFEVFYQPLLKVSGGIGGFEALLRWRHPVRGMVSPGLFIPIAEETGLIKRIGTWVLGQACRDAAAWPAGIKVAVNVSPLQFVEAGLVADIRQALDASGLPASQLEVEITESVLIGDDNAVLQTLHAIRNLGVRVSMDDFGTGYSSLSYLRRFPFDKIKIDQSFVAGMSGQKDCLAIVQAVIGLGRSLGMVVNAEGVETEQQRSLLAQEGCGELQGYLISRPVALPFVDALLREHGLARNPARLLEEPVLS